MHIQLTIRSYTVIITGTRCHTTTDRPRILVAGLHHTTQRFSALVVVKKLLYSEFLYITRQNTTQRKRYKKQQQKQQQPKTTTTKKQQQTKNTDSDRREETEIGNTFKNTTINHTSFHTNTWFPFATSITFFCHNHMLYHTQLPQRFAHTDIPFSGHLLLKIR